MMTTIKRSFLNRHKAGRILLSSFVTLWVFYSGTYGSMAKAQTPVLIDEDTGVLYDGADQIKTSFSNDDKNVLFGSSRKFVNIRESKLQRVKFNRNVRFMSDLKNAPEISDMAIEPDKITIQFVSRDARKTFVEKVKRHSHRFGAGFTNRLFSKDAILLGTSKTQRIPFVRKIDHVEKDDLEVVVYTKPVHSRMEVFDKISYQLHVPMNPRNMVSKRRIKARIKQRLGRDITDGEMFLDDAGKFTTLQAEMIKELERGNNVEQIMASEQMAVNNATAGDSFKVTPQNINLDDYRDPAGSNYCNSGSLIHAPLDIQLYPANNAPGSAKVGTGGCFSLGVSAVVEMNDANYFKAYVEGKEKLWLDLIFASSSDSYVNEIQNLVDGDVPLYGSFFLGVSLSFGVDLGTEVNVQSGLSVVGGFNQQWSMKRGFVVDHGQFSKITDKDDSFEFHPLKVEGAVNIYGQVSLEPYFGVSVDVLLMEAAEGAIKLEPYVYGEVDFHKDTYQDATSLGAYTNEICYDAGYGLKWKYYIHGLFGAIGYDSPDFPIVGPKSFLRGGSKECFPADANGIPTSLSQEQLAEISSEFDNCLDWSETWNSGLACWLTGDNHYAFQKHLGPDYDSDPAKWAVGGVYYNKYDAWDIGGEDVLPQDEHQWAMDWANLITSAYGNGSTYGSLYGAANLVDLYEKHKPNGSIQSLIDTQCTEESNRYIWTDFKAQLCTHLWDWYEDGYYGPEVNLVTSVVEQTLDTSIYDPATDTWSNDPSTTTVSYEVKRVVYAYGPNDPNQDLLRTRRWSPKYCYDWYEVVQQGTEPEDIEFFLTKCKYTLIEEPETNADKKLGVNRQSLYEKISESYCEHLECPFTQTNVSLCPGGLDKNDGTSQAARRKSLKAWDPQTGTWIARRRTDDSCPTEAGGVVIGDIKDYGMLSDAAHSNDNCSTTPYCTIYDNGTPYCTREYWDEIQTRCAIGSNPDIVEIRDGLLDVGVDNLHQFKYPKWFTEQDIDKTLNDLDTYFQAIPGTSATITQEKPPRTRQPQFSFGADVPSINAFTINEMVNVTNP